MVMDIGTQVQQGMRKTLWPCKGHLHNAVWEAWQITKNGSWGTMLWWHVMASGTSKKTTGITKVSCQEHFFTQTGPAILTLNSPNPFSASIARSVLWTFSLPPICLLVLSKVIPLWEMLALLIILEDCSRHNFRRDAVSFVCTVHPGKRISLLKSNIAFSQVLSFLFFLLFFLSNGIMACSVGVGRHSHPFGIACLCTQALCAQLVGFTWLPVLANDLHPAGA